MSILNNARKGQIDDVVEQVASGEKIEPNLLCKAIADGTVVVPANKHKRLTKPCGIGKGLKVKVNANIGSSQYEPSLKTEETKLRAAEEFGADTVMDLSTGGDLNEFRRHITGLSNIPVGTVPIYQYMVENQGACELDLGDRLLALLQQHGEDGVDFVTVHCGVTRKAVENIEEERFTGIVSRGGAYLARWMKKTGAENPLYSRFDEVCEILASHEMTLSLGDGLRSGCIHDANDRAMLCEMLTLGELANRAKDSGVQVIIEGPGHMAADQIEANVKLQKKICGGAPYYVLGPLVTDIAPGYDHITSAIGGTIAAIAGADFLCYVTPAEHLKLPDLDDVREGVIASRIAAHAADIVKGIPDAAQWDNEMSKARKSLNWDAMFELCIDPKTAKEMRQESGLTGERICTMCGAYCSMKEETRDNQ